MFSRLRSAITYANTVSTLALFLALGGAAYAAVKLPSNSVGTKQIKKGAVTQSKISASAQSALKGKTGAQGPQGFTGFTGATGAPGAAGTPGAPGDAAPSPLIARITGISSGYYAGPVSGTAAGSTSSDAVLDWSPAAAVTAEDLDAWVGNGNSGVVITLYTGSGVASALTCTTGSNGQCTNTTAQVSIPAGTIMYWVVDNTTGASIAAEIGMEMTA